MTRGYRNREGRNRGLARVGRGVDIRGRGVVRQRSAQEITNEQVGHFELFRLSLRDIRWWWGGLAATASFGLQAAALVLGSVVLVQAPQVTALLFACVRRCRFRAP